MQIERFKQDGLSGTYLKPIPTASAVEVVTSAWRDGITIKETWEAGSIIGTRVFHHVELSSQECSEILRVLVAQDVFAVLEAIKSHHAAMLDQTYAKDETIEDLRAEIRDLKNQHGGK